MNDTVEPLFNHDVDVFAVADYLISLDALRSEPDVTPLKLAKLLYLAQANYLASTGRRMFDEPVEAFDHGPVVYREWKRHPGSQIIAVRDDALAGADSLPEDIADFLDVVWSRYEDWSASALRRLTHEQAPWKDNYYEGGRRISIPDRDMAAYFREHVPAADRVFHPSVVIIPSGFLTDEDADVFAATVAEYTGP